MGGTRGRGQIYPDWSRSSDTIYNASATSKVNKIIRKEKDKYEIIIDNASSDGRKMIDIVSPRPELII